MGKGLIMNQALTTTGKFIRDFESPKNQQSLKQYFDKDDTGQKLFTQVVVRAIQQDPDLLNADRTSLFLACQTAAQDGLLPDKKDGALVIYNVNVGTKANPTWKKIVQWQPMIGGLRKKLAMHGFLGLRAELVYENDVKDGRFRYEKGDEPKIIHTPNEFGERGEIVGAYAIVTDTNTGEIYRDTMTIGDMEVTRSKSKNPHGGAWKDYTNEMYRKTMARRLFKQLPLISPEVIDLIQRDDERNFDFSDTPKSSSVAQEVQEAARSKPLEGEVVKKKKVAKKKVAKKPEPEQPDLGPEPPPEEEVDPLSEVG
jgi:recombination protein RecT